MDIDGLKQINDALGHQAGDLAICAVANAAASGATIVGRLGGDEFGLLFEQHTLAKVFWKMEVLRDSLASTAVQTATGCLKVTCSIGVGDCSPSETVDQFLGRVDAALFDAKSRGRNCVNVASREARQGSPNLVRREVRASLNGAG
jgi:diguanylate cyclase (GGDEF)-like protein